ncbi:MAG: acyltransferase family protein [Chloroflexi bacterium]|nr:acyltransferase family protein [Chloroflexota bacterium]
MSEKPRRMQEFEALRGLSILLLLALHSEVFDSGVFGFEVGPLAGVVASFLLGSFFFLAGFFAEFSRQRGDAVSFAKSKVIRIFPPYWLALALFIFVLGYTLKRFDTAAYALNMQWLLSPTFVKRVLTLWYISVLVGYYILFGVLLFTVKSNLGLLISSAAMFAAAYLANLTVGLFEPRFFQYFFIFLAGIYFYRFEAVRKRLMDVNLLYTILAAAMLIVPFWLVSASGYEVTDPLFILTADLFILGWVWMLLSLFRFPLGGWKMWAFLSTASFFTYLYHRPIWQVLDMAFGLEEPGMVKIFFHLIPGSIVALTVGYFLQRGYDCLLALLRLK